MLKQGDPGPELVLELVQNWSLYPPRSISLRNCTWEGLHGPDVSAPDMYVPTIPLPRAPPSCYPVVNIACTHRAQNPRKGSIRLLLTHLRCFTTPLGKAVTP